MQRLWLFVIACGLAVGTMSGAALTAQAQESEPKILLVLDSSGSMRKPDASGVSKIEAAKRALTQVVRTLPDGTQVGLRVYGATQRGGKPTPQRCSDTQLVHPIAALDRPGLIAAIKQFQPKGETPIAYSLGEAAKDLGSDGERHIILVSDGEESCVPDPCDQIRKIEGLGINLQIDTVGFAVDAKARTQLQCVARVGNGQYFDAQNADSLADTLRKTATRAARTFLVQGEPVTATADPESAPTLAPGQYTDRFALDEGKRYYRVKRSIPNSTLHVSVTPQSGPAAVLDSDLFRVDASTGSDGVDCGMDLAVSDVTEARVATAVLDLPSDPAQIKQECTDADEFLVAVSKNRGDGTGDGSVEVIVTEDPPVTNLSDLPAAVTETPKGMVPGPVPAGSGPRLKGATVVVGGGGFTDAARLDPGLAQDTLLPGEQLFYKVRVGYGQTVSAKVFVNPSKRAIVAGQRVAITLWNPLRRVMSTGPRWRVQDNDPTALLQVSSAEVRYLNRGASVSGPTADQVAGADMAGDYYLTVGRSVESFPERNGPLPVLIEISVDGVESGVPTYAEPEATKPGAKPSKAKVEEAAESPWYQRGSTWLGVGGGVVLLAAAAFVTSRRGRD